MDQNEKKIRAQLARAKGGHRRIWQRRLDALTPAVTVAPTPKAVPKAVPVVTKKAAKKVVKKK